MKTTSKILLLSSLLIFIGCGDSQTEKQHTTETKTVTNHTQPTQTKKEIVTDKKYTMDEIYNSMCIQCHSSNGSGNTEKLTPSMVGQTQQEIESSLIDIEKDKGHIIMEHNHGEILKKGMNYSPKEMSVYMDKRFNK